MKINHKDPTVIWFGRDHNGPDRPVELAALHAAAKNIINLTARTGGMYGGGALPRSPRQLVVTFCVAPRQSVGRQRPKTTDNVWRSYCESPAPTSRASMQHATTVLMDLIS